MRYLIQSLAFIALDIMCLISVVQGAAVKKSSAGCTKTNVRKEIRDLSSSEVKNLINAIKTLSTTPSKIDPTRSRYDDFTYIHIAHFQEIHGRPITWPWHRKFITDFESALQDIDPSVTLPYWNEAYDASSFTDNEVLGPKGLFGSSSGPGNCTKGVFKDFIVNFKGGGSRDPKTGTVIPKRNRHCLTRGFLEGDVFSIRMSEAEQKMLLSDDKSYYDTFRTTLEVVFHALPHMVLGGEGMNPGDMATHQSPNDPIFWLHHAYLDYIWYKWQKKSAKNMNAYDGPNCSVLDKQRGVDSDPHLKCYKNGTKEFRQSSVDDRVAGGLVGSVKDMMDVSSLCVTYQDPKKAVASQGKLSIMPISSEINISPLETKNIPLETKTIVKSKIKFSYFANFTKSHFGFDIDAASKVIPPSIFQDFKSSFSDD